MKVKPTVPNSFKIAEGSLGVQNPMINGLRGANNDVEVVHPLEDSERKVRIPLYI